MKNEWRFLVFWFVLSMHVQWARAAQKPVVLTEGPAPIGVGAIQDDDRETFSKDVSPYGWTSFGMSCTQEERNGCVERCVDEGEAMPGSHILQSATCSVMRSTMELSCHCVWNLPGPYAPPCYWNCGGSRNSFGPY